MAACIFERHILNPTKKCVKLSTRKTRIQYFMSYHETSIIIHTKSLNLNISRLILQLYLLNPLKPRVKSRMKM